MYDNDIEIAEFMMTLIDKKRFFHENSWLDIGKCFHNVYGGSETGILKWITHTESVLVDQEIPAFIGTRKDIKEVCTNLYYTFENSGITVKTLAWYAREDFTELYEKWHKDWCQYDFQDESVLSIAKIFYRTYWMDFIYCPIGDGSWFQFKNHRWRKDCQGVNLRKTISSDFIRRFENDFAALKFREGLSDIDRKIRLTKVRTIIQKLKTIEFKTKLSITARDYFSNKLFLEITDTNCEFLGVANGVLEISKNQVIFRAGKPEDYISLTTNIPYRQELDWDHHLVGECMKWFGQVFADSKLLHHFLKFSSSCINGYNDNKIFAMFYGGGSNSKYSIENLFKETFGLYCVSQSSKCKRRITFVNKINDGDQIKKLVRLSKTIICCNNLPIIDQPDNFTKNCISVYPFTSKWINNAPEDEFEQYLKRTFKLDYSFDKRIKILAPAFLWIIANYYPFFSEEGLCEPDIITEATQNYWNDNDIYTQFVRDTISENSDHTIGISLNTVYSEFKTWSRENYPDSAIPPKHIVKKSLSVKWGPLTDNKWYGIKF